ncbi:lytic murein transglycosylase [Mesorhizobium sp. M7A.F.Ca.US.006.01.1.1]|nr:lytic murein transglycosylase [Mesorhizobium sp. M7A.F.Ca.US.006.01.1.1]
MARLADLAPYGAPLWPAGHLPLKGGDRLPCRLSPISNLVKREPSAKLPISPLEGEMSGRTEGGATERKPPSLAWSTRP